MVTKQVESQGTAQTAPGLASTYREGTDMEDLSHTSDEATDQWIKAGVVGEMLAAGAVDLDTIVDLIESFTPLGEDPADTNRRAGALLAGWYGWMHM